MTQSRELRVYVDSSVLVSYSTKQHKFFAYAMNFLMKAQGGRYKAVISVLALMESVKGIRSLLVRKGVRDPTIWQKAVQDCFNGLYQMKNLEFVHGQELQRTTTTQLLSDMLWGGFDILLKYPGKAIDKDEQGRRLSQLEHDGLSAADVTHIMLAKSSDCDYLATFDQDYEESKSEIHPVVLYKSGVP